MDRIRRYQMSMKRVVPRAITSFNNKDDRYRLFRYLLKLANLCGANKFNNKQLPVDGDELYRLITLMRPEDIRVKDDYGQTLLHIIAQYCRGEDMAMLLDVKFKDHIEVDAVDKLGYTPLLYAALANNVDTAEVLVEKQADLGVTVGDARRSALHVAAMFGCKEVTRFLLQKKCDINIKDSHGQTPLSLSSYYKHSHVTVFLIALGADAFIQDNEGVSAAIRIAHNMPVVIRDVFDKLCSEDVLKGERLYHLETVLTEAECDVKTSFFQFLVWQGNIGTMEHPVFKHLTETKWLLYGAKPNKRNFLSLFLVSVIWTLLYLQRESFFDLQKEEKYMHFIHIGVYIAAMGGYFHRLKVNLTMIHRRRLYLKHIRGVLGVMDEVENQIMHPKGRHLLQSAQEESDKGSDMTFISDIKNSPALVADLISDHMMLLYMVMKISSLFFGQEYIMIKNIENIFGAIAIIVMWTNAFLKLQITKKIGPFVVFMKYVPSDLWTVTTMFITLFIPAFLVFYKTIFIKDGKQPTPSGDVEEEDVVSISKRAAAKGGKGGTPGEYRELNIVGTFFVVLRMVLVDYEYMDGYSRSDPPFWWMLMSLGWVVVSSIIVLNLMIAIMADSYTRIYERSEISSRVRRAESIADLERGMGAQELADSINCMVEMSPILIKFDPVCDRDKIEIMEAKVQRLYKKVVRLEQTVNNKLFINLKRRLDFIETKVNIQSYKPTTAAPFFRYG